MPVEKFLINLKSGQLRTHNYAFLDKSWKVAYIDKDSTLHFRAEIFRCRLKKSQSCYFDSAKAEGIREIFYLAIFQDFSVAGAPSK